MFGRERQRTSSRQATLLLASVVGRFDWSTKMTPDALVHRLGAFLECTAEAVRDLGGQVNVFVGNCSVAVWVLESGGGSVDPVRVARELVRRLRSDIDVGRVPGASGLRLRIGLAKGDCVFEEARGRIGRIVGHAWFRLDELRTNSDLPGDTIVIDSSLKGDFAAVGLVDLGEGAFRVMDVVP